MQPVFRPVADRGLLVELADRTSPESLRAVQALDRALARSPAPGQREVVPALVNLLVVFDPVQTDHATVAAHVERLLAQPDHGAHQPETHVIPVCYDDIFAPDLPQVAALTGLSPEAVIAAHLGAVFEVGMYGFAPGYAYLTGLPDSLRLDRKPSPRRGVPAGSVIIAGTQCLITTLTMPTGWWIIGRSPARVLTGEAERPFLFAVGDRVRFARIGADEMGVAP